MRNLQIKRMMSSENEGVFATSKFMLRDRDQHLATEPILHALLLPMMTDEVVQVGNAEAEAWLKNPITARYLEEVHGDVPEWMIHRRVNVDDDILPTDEDVDDPTFTPPPQREGRATIAGFPGERGGDPTDALTVEESESRQPRRRRPQSRGRRLTE